MNAHALWQGVSCLAKPQMGTGLVSSFLYLPYTYYTPISVPSQGGILSHHAPQGLASIPMSEARGLTLDLIIIGWGISFDMQNTIVSGAPLNIYRVAH
jgi:hypothetical protein